MSDRIPVAGEVWTAKHGDATATILGVHDIWVWVEVSQYSPGSCSIMWFTGAYNPPRKVSREIQLIRTTKGGVWSGSMTAEPMPGERTIGTVVVYDDNTIEVKNATD